MACYADIKNSKRSAFEGNKRQYLTVDGYTKRSGSPTDYMVQLKDKGNRWYRGRCFCISNNGTLFVRTKENSFLIVNEWELTK